MRNLVFCMAMSVSLPMGMTSASAEKKPAAKTASPAERLYREGEALFRAGEYQAARDKFQAAYNIDPSPVLLYNLARTAEETGDARGAVGYYEAYLARFPDAQDRPEVERRIRTMRALMARMGNEEPAQPPVAAEPPGPEASPEPAPETTARKPAPPPAARSDWRTPTGWTLVALGGVSAGLAVWSGLSATSSEDDAASLEQRIADGDRQASTFADYNTARDDADSASGRATLAWIGTGLFVAAGASLLIWSATDTPEGEVKVGVAPTPGGLGLWGRF